MRRALALVLAGGEGRRLAPLTKERSKPAVYFGGRYRLVDFVLSNLVNSGFTRIKVICQYRSSSLIRHLTRAWPLASTLLPQYVEPVPAAMNLGPQWFTGTADAIWQNLDLLRDVRPDDVLIFGADHVYKMDVGEMYDFHSELDADLTVSTLRIPRSEASRFGCVDVDEHGRVKGFLEKPDNPPGLPDDPDSTLVSMGNYIFKTPALLSELARDAHEEQTSRDFGKDILATAHERLNVFAYDFNDQICPGESDHSRGYWRDVGTIDSYYEANMDLISVDPYLNLYNEEWPIRGVHPMKGPAKFVFADERGGRIGKATESLVSAGCIISGGHVERSICSYGVRVNSYSKVSGCVLFPDVEIARGARVRRCIIDKGVRIPEGEVIGEDPDLDRARFTVSDDGVVVIGRAHYGQVDEFDQEVL